MNKRILQRILAGMFCAAVAGTAAAQITAAIAADDPADTKTSPTRAGGDTTPPPAPADAKSDSDGKMAARGEAKTDSDKTMASSSKKAKPEQHAQAKPTTDKKPMQHHAAKSTEDKSATSDEKAFRQALRGCATQQDQSQRDSCLDEAIEKFQRG